MAKLKTKRNRRIATPPHLDILADISTLISHSHDLQETLDRMVATVAERMQTEVCSLYIFDPKKNRLTLCAPPWDSIPSRSAKYPWAPAKVSPVWCIEQNEARDGGRCPGTPALQIFS